jgi:hypothetical protein
VKRIVLYILLCHSFGNFAQTKSHQYYFTLTGDTVLYPYACTNDSTYFFIAAFKNQKRTELSRFAVKGYDNYSIPNKILVDYDLRFKGIRIANDSTKKSIFVKEEITKNIEIGLSNDMTKKLFEIKAQIDIYNKGKKVLNTFTTEQNYDAKLKKDFKRERFYRYNIIKSENSPRYFVTISPYKHHPAGFDIPWEILESFTILVCEK